MFPLGLCWLKKMQGSDLQAWLDKWKLTASVGAKVLCIQKSKMSDYLNDKRAIPAYVAAHVETFGYLAKSDFEEIVAKRVG